MSTSQKLRAAKTDAQIVIEGYASLFALPDQAGDIIRSGAFRASLAARSAPLPMLFEHEQRLRAGAWFEAREDRRGLYVRGAIAADAPGAARAARFLARGGDGLSIGFVPVSARALSGGGRVLEEVDIVEVSLVQNPMQPLARLTLARGPIRAL